MGLLQHSLCQLVGEFLIPAANSGFYFSRLSSVAFRFPRSMSKYDTKYAKICGLKKTKEEQRMPSSSSSPHFV